MNEISKTLAFNSSLIVHNFFNFNISKFKKHFSKYIPNNKDSQLVILLNFKK